MYGRALVILRNNNNNVTRRTTTRSIVLLSIQSQRIPTTTIMKLPVLSTTTTSLYYVLVSPLFVRNSSSAFGNAANTFGNSVSSSTTTSHSSWIQQRFFSSSSSTSGSTTSSTTLMAAASNNNKKDPPFPTWTFDKPCTTMEWSPLSHVTVDVAPIITSIGDGTDTTLFDADLLIVGITSEASKDDADKEKEEENEEESKEAKVLQLEGTVKAIDDITNNVVSEILQESIKAFKNGSKAGSLSPTVRVFNNENKVTKRYALLGLGSPKETGTVESEEGNKEKSLEWTTGVGMSIGKGLAQHISNLQKVSTIHVLLPSTLLYNASIVQDIVTTFYSELHVDNRYRTGNNVKQIAEHVKSITFVPFSDSENDTMSLTADSVSNAIETGRKLAQGIILTKDIVNAPHNVLNSQSLADTAKRLVKDISQSLKCTVLGKKECEQRNMGAYLGVARGSETEPQFIHITYTPPGGSTSNTKKIAVVGKGLLFDTGGYNIKTAMMEMMKFDCGGAAAVFGAAKAIGMIQPPDIEVHFIVAACENMINDRAMVPSDILTASNGKTIEVLNTDAEGRLTLADALVYADKELNCESIIELSTLTGACMVALGKSVSAVYTDNDTLAQELADISKVTGDKSWRMPLEKEYNEQLESKFADLKNIGGKYGGSITAALFLQHFVSKKKPFAHIDIAGPVWSDKIGATGYGTKLIVEWVKRQGKK